MSTQTPVKNSGPSSISRNSGLPPYTLRARGGDIKSKDETKRPTDPVGLSQSIIHVLRQNPEGWCDVQCVGANALWAASAAFRLASIEAERRTSTAGLVLRQIEYQAEINGKAAKGICLHIFPVAVEYII